MSAAREWPQPGAWLALIGIGEDGVDGLTPAARTLLEGAALVAGGARHLALAAPLIRGARMEWPSPMQAAYAAILGRRGEPVVVLASGDPFCHGVGSVLAAQVPSGELLCLPAPSAFSLACARLAWPLPEVSTVSLCGRPVAMLRPLLQPGRRVLALSADETTPGQVATLLRAEGFGGSRVHLLEALGGPRERVRSWPAAGSLPAEIERLNLVGIEVVAEAGARVIPLVPGLPDAWFEHDGQLTKAEVRAVTLSALAPRRGELLWDVGAGSGAVGIEWMLADSANRAVAVEVRPDRLARVARNAAALGVPGLALREGEAPAAFEGLAVPDAVFLGGGARHAGVIEAAWAALRPGGRIVANGVTLETEARLVEAWRAFGGGLVRLAVSRVDAVGSLHGFRPAMTVTQWVAAKS